MLAPTATKDKEKDKKEPVPADLKSTLVPPPDDAPHVQSDAPGKQKVAAAAEKQFLDTLGPDMNDPNAPAAAATAAASAFKKAIEKQIDKSLKKLLPDIMELHHKMIRDDIKLVLKETLGSYLAFIGTNANASPGSQQQKETKQTQTKREQPQLTQEEQQLVIQKQIQDQIEKIVENHPDYQHQYAYPNAHQAFGYGPGFYGAYQPAPQRNPYQNHHKLYAHPHNVPIHPPFPVPNIPKHYEQYQLPPKREPGVAERPPKPPRNPIPIIDPATIKNTATRALISEMAEMAKQILPLRPPLFPVEKPKQAQPDPQPAPQPAVTNDQQPAPQPVTAKQPIQQPAPQPAVVKQPIQQPAPQPAVVKQPYQQPIPKETPKAQEQTKPKAEAQAQPQAPKDQQDQQEPKESKETEPDTEKRVPSGAGAIAPNRPKPAAAPIGPREILPQIRDMIPVATDQLKPIRIDAIQLRQAKRYFNGCLVPKFPVNLFPPEYAFRNGDIEDVISSAASSLLHTSLLSNLKDLDCPEIVREQRFFLSVIALILRRGIESRTYKKRDDGSYTMKMKLILSEGRDKVLYFGKAFPGNEVKYKNNSVEIKEVAFRTIRSLVLPDGTVL